MLRVNSYSDLLVKAEALECSKVVVLKAIKGILLKVFLRLEQHFNSILIGLVSDLNLFGDRET